MMYSIFLPSPCDVVVGGRGWGFPREDLERSPDRFCLTPIPQFTSFTGPFPLAPQREGMVSVRGDCNGYEGLTS